MTTPWTDEDRSRCLHLKAQRRTAPQIAMALDKTVESVRGILRRERAKVRVPVSKLVYRRDFEIPAARINDDGKHLRFVLECREEGFPVLDVSPFRQVRRAAA